MADLVAHDDSELSNTVETEQKIPVEGEKSDDIYIETFFDDGPLGVTLRRRAEDGIVFIFEVIQDSQAVHLDVAPGDELWAAGDMDIGGASLDKEAWNGLIAFIKQSPRPLRLVWKRSKHPVPIAPPPSLATVPSTKSVRGSGSTEEHSPEYLELQKVLVRLVIGKETNNVLGLVAAANQPKKTNFPEPLSLLKEGRRIIKTGELNIETKNNSLWLKSNNKRKLILLNDLLLITIPQTGNVFAFEYIIDLQICKVKSLGLPQFGAEPTPEDLAFELLWPGGDVQLRAESVDVKDSWVMSIYVAICDSLQGTIDYLGWRHQYLIGTMHSAVLTRNEDRVRELISLCKSEKLDYKVLESFDDDGYTPLHYACILRLQNIVRLLHEATADVTAADNHGFTPLHWAAMQLDDFSLGLLCSHVFDLDVLDKQNRSPLVLACLEGRDISGNTDPLLLKKCLEIMISHKPQLHWVDASNRSLIHYLAASWQNEPMEILLENGCPDVNLVDSEFGMTPLHFAARANPIKNAIGEGMRLLNVTKLDDSNDNQPELINASGAVDTIRSLLQYGAKPNVRDNTGRTVLHILLAPEVVILWEMEELETAVALLISYGARPDELLISTMKSKFPELNTAAFIEKWISLPSIDCKKLDIKIGEYEPLPEINNSIEPATPTSPSSSNRLSEQKHSFCSMCGFQFTMFKRQHHCRLCSSVCCDDCSKKRTIIDGKEVRTCDCCFNRALMAQDKFNAKFVIANMRPLTATTSNSDQSDRTGVVSSVDNDNKKELFGGSLTPSNDNSITRRKSAEPVTAKTQNRLGGTMAVMSDTHEKLLERGEKLSRLQDRTDELSNQAGEFARLAKQLNEQQKSRWF